MFVNYDGQQEQPVKEIILLPMHGSSMLTHIIHMVMVSKESSLSFQCSPYSGHGQ